MQELRTLPMSRPIPFPLRCASRMARFPGLLLAALCCCQGALAQQFWMPQLVFETVATERQASPLRPSNHPVMSVSAGANAEEASVLEAPVDSRRMAVPSPLTRGRDLRQVWHWIEQEIRDERQVDDLAGVALDVGQPQLVERRLLQTEESDESVCDDLAFWRGPEQLLVSERTDVPPPSVWSLMSVGDEVSYWIPAFSVGATVLADVLDGAPTSVGEGGNRSFPNVIPPGASADAESSAWSPRLHVGIKKIYDLDRSLGGLSALHRLFPLSQSGAAYGDLGGQEPAYNISVGTSVQATQTFTLSATVHWLRSEAEVGSGQGSVSSMMRLPDLSAWPDIGAELDIALNCRIGDHTGLLLGCGRFFASDSVDENGPVRDVEFVYATVQFRF